jgi:hypothetical protein
MPLSFAFESMLVGICLDKDVSATDFKDKENIILASHRSRLLWQKSFEESG